MATLGAVAVSTGISVHDARSLQHALRDGGAQLASAAGARTAASPRTTLLGVGGRTVGGHCHL